MRITGNRTRYPGVFKIDEMSYRIRAVGTDPKTGKRRQAERVLSGVSAAEAARRRSELQAEMSVGVGVRGSQPGRLRVGDYARSWMESKVHGIEAGTAKRYATALEDHILPGVGDYYLDALSTMDVQEWVNASVIKLDPRTRKTYGIATVLGWWRVLRVMLRDAVAQLDLPRDPTRRINLPMAPAKEGNALSAEKLVRFLMPLREQYPQHYALGATLAFTGLRFCHASALRWEDIDEQTNVIRIVRKQVRGRVGNVSKKKQAPRELPLAPQLATILREHRHRLLETQAPGVASGWVFPSTGTGKLRDWASLTKAWRASLKAAGITERFTPHGLRRTFNDQLRLAKVDPIIARAITGHVTEAMREHYSSVGLEEKRAAVASALLLLPRRESADKGADVAAAGAGLPVAAAANIVQS